MDKRQCPLRRFLALPNDSRVKTLIVAVAVAFVAALAVSFAAVTLNPRIEANRAAERQVRIDLMLDQLPGLRDLMLEAGVDALESRIVNLDDGQFVDGVDAGSFDMAAASAAPETSIALPPEQDVAGIKRRANMAPVFLMQRDGKLMLVVLPVYGAGYQSTIRAYLALEADLVTVAGLTIIEQGETPGLGARIEDPAWLALWPGKEIADTEGNIVISVVRGQATAPYEVDGISGATRTGNGVTGMLRFWLGGLGFGPFLTRLAEEGL